MRFSTIVFLLTLTAMSHAAVYKWIDKDGKTHYSDNPISNSEAVKFKDNTQNQIKLLVPVAISSETTVEQNTSIPYKLKISSPKEEETIRNNEGEITIMAMISPELTAKHTLVLLMDGVLVGTPQKKLIFNLKNIDRGEHSFIIKVITQNGKELASTSPRRVYLHRATVRPRKTLTQPNAR